MDSYDLFGEDGGSSMLDGLTDFGGENLDGGSARDGGYGAASAQNAGGGRDGGYGSQSAQPPPQPQYGQSLPQESPLAKLASFGGDFSHMDPSQATQQQQQSLYHQSHPAHPGYSAPPRPIAQSGASYQPHMRSMPTHPTHRPSGYPASGYPSMPENMYAMDRQSSNLQSWNGPSGYSSNMRHYSSQMTQPQATYRSHVNYPQQQAEKLPQQYPGGQMMGYQPSSHYPPSSHYSASQYDSYGRVAHHNLYQQSAPQSPQYPQTPQQPQYSTPQGYSHMQSSQLMGYHQQSPAMPRPAPAADVPSYPQKSAIPPALGGSSPQYRAPFPQLSPQISPRPQMSPRPQAPAPPQPPPSQSQQMSPRPVMSPAKPTTLSPHPLTPKSTSSPAPTSGNFPPQSTLQQLEQMVPPYNARQNQNNPQSPAMGGRVPVSPQPWPTPNAVDNQLTSQDSMASFHAMSANEEATPTSSLETNSEKQKQGLEMDARGPGMLENNTMSPNETPDTPVEQKSHEPKGKPHASPLHASGPHSSPHHGAQAHSQGPSPHPSHPSPQPMQSPHQTALQSPLQNTMQSPHQTSLHSPHQSSHQTSHAGSHPTSHQPPAPAPHQQPHQTSIPPIQPSHQTNLNPHQTNLKDTSDSLMDGSHGMMGPGHHHHMASHMSGHLGLGQQRFPDFNTPGGYSSGKMDELYPPSMDQSSYQQGLDPRMMGRQQGMYNMSGGSMMGLGLGAGDMFSHQQEVAALQQQLQELYCMPPAPIHQEKMTQLEERLRTLQQHEAATNCQGGPLCVLPGPMFGASLIQGSPQVTSTTGRGRGRGRGPAKPRKTKKQKLAEQQQQQMLEQQQQQQQQMMMQHQQQFRQMNYQSKGMPHEMNSLMAGNMGNLSNLGLMNSLNMPSIPSMPGMTPAAPNIPNLPNLPSAPMQMPPNVGNMTPPSMLHNPAMGSAPGMTGMMTGMSPTMPGMPHPAPIHAPMPHPLAQNKMVSPPNQAPHMPHAPSAIYPPITHPPESTSPIRPPKIPTPPVERGEPPPAPAPPPPLPPPPLPVIAPPPVMPTPTPVEEPPEEPTNSIPAPSSMQSPEPEPTPEPHEQREVRESIEPSEPPELSTTCDVDSSTNPEPSNPYDFPADSPSESFRTPEPEVDPYLMTDEALGGEIIPRKIRKPRKTKEPKEPKAPKEPKPPKEPKVRRPRTPKSVKTSPDGSIPEEKVKSPRKKREPKTPKDPKNPKKRGKKRKVSDTEMEEWDLPEPEEKRPSLAVETNDRFSGSEIPDGNEVVENGPADEMEEIEEPEPEREPDPEPMEDVSPDVTPKKRGRKRESGKPAAVRSAGKKKSSSRKKKTTMLGDVSDEETGLVSTPPPSPGDDFDNPNKRRSARNTQRKKYCDDIMLAMSDDESGKSPTPDSYSHSSKTGLSSPRDSRYPRDSRIVDPPIKPNFVYVNTTDEDSMVVQHVLAVRKGRREIKVPVDAPEMPKLEPLEANEASPNENNPEKHTEPKLEPETENKENKTEPDEGGEKPEITEADQPEGSEATRTEIVEVDEYLVKYRNFSYLHCEWRTEDELRRGDRRTFSKIKRFQMKMANSLNLFEMLEDEPFNPDFIEIDRVLDVAEHTDPATEQTVKHYLVKWRSMQYDDSTWELEGDVDQDAILQFERFRKPLPKDKLKIKRRPTPEQWRKLEKSPIYKNNNTLRPYQLEGLNWLLFSWHNGRNCILADEMGLGKTIQSLTFVKAVHDYGIRGPFLVIAPLSTIPNWQREFEGWTDLNVIVYHGSAASLQMIQEYEFYYKNEKGPMKDMHKFNVLITTFELIITHSQELKNFNWRACVIDEAHRLKNRNCKLLEGLRLLNMEHRVLLSGTPLQNNVNELFSLLNFLEPAQFASGDAFLQEFGALKTESEVNKLQAILKPMMLRRMKEDVEKSLAPKEETVVEVELTNIQKKYYRGILERNFSFLAKGTTTSNIPNLMNTMMELRKCCIHPYLLNGAEEQIQIDYKTSYGEDAASYYKALIQSSGKMVLVDKLLPKLKSNGHRVLIFSQMVKCLDILEDYLIYRKYPFERIDGRIRGDLRQAAIDRFCRPDSDRFVFLLCTKAGGLGINLTAADTVIIYDSDWNPQNDLQAQARCHRIGQQKMVKVYRLICRNTYEREMFDKASLKLGLDKAVLQSMNTTQGGKEPAQRQLSKKEIEDLLKRGAYGAVMDEDAGDKFCEEDIDQILERRTQVITLESEKGSTFSKASFTSSDIRQDINIDDPDFWKKWAKRAEIDTTPKDEKERLVMSEPRRRTQIKRYGQDDATLDMSDLGSDSGPSAESDDDTSLGVGRGRGKKNKLKRRRKLLAAQVLAASQALDDDYMPKEGDIPYGSWSRSECFKVEKGLLTYGWDRWHDIMITTQFRKGWRVPTVEDCARIILVYCLRYYRGDEKIRNFIWDLITPPEMGGKIGKNHHGLSAPVPRGRNLARSRYKGKDRIRGFYDTDHWSNCDKYDGELLLDSNYKKHLSRHANKVLLRVRLLYYIKHEIIGDLAHQIAEGLHSSLMPIQPPLCDMPPTSWWDIEADRSLLVGTYKHGYEAYSAMRNDHTLSFLARVGPDLNTEHTREELDEEKELDEEENESCSALNMDPGDSSRDAEPSNESTTDKADKPEQPESDQQAGTPAAAVAVEPNGEPSTTSVTAEPIEGKLDWPSIGDLNARLRRVITAYQKNFRKEEIKQLQKARKMERREKIEQIVREREKMRLEMSQRKWSRREEVDFFRTISSFGVEYNKHRKQYDWNKFRSLSRLEKKTDESMTEYYNAFYTMLKRSSGLRVSEEEECQDLIVEPLSEEKARKTLEIIELLSKIREEILPHPMLEQRLRLCKTSADVPDWWVPGKHDKDLLVGVAKHGLARTDFFLLNDPELSFKEVIKTSLVDDPASFLREKFAESFKSEFKALEEKAASQEAAKKQMSVADEEKKTVKDEVAVEGSEIKDEESSELAKNAEEPKPEEKEIKEEMDVDKEESAEKEPSNNESDEVNAMEVDTSEVKAEDTSDKPEAPVEDKKEDEPEKEKTPEETEKIASAEPENELEADTEMDNDHPADDDFSDDETPLDIVAAKQNKDKVKGQDKKKDESIYDFEDDIETSKLKLTHDRPRRRSQSDTEGDAESEEERNRRVREEAYKDIDTQLDSSKVVKHLKESTGVDWPRIPDMDAHAWSPARSEARSDAPSEASLAQLIAHSYQNPVKWPRDHAVLARLNHIIHAVENKEWPASTTFSAATPERSSIATPDHFDHHPKKPQNIAIDVETERAKLHALLNCAAAGATDESLSEDSRRSTPSSLQPPPAHQQSRCYLPFDLSKFHTTTTKTATSNGSSSNQPMDLSAVSKPQDLSMVQDLSSKTKPAPAKSKLDNMLDKLLKRKNIAPEEPIVEKEKKRRKLDEIVLGLSAARDHTLKGANLSPSVTVTPAGMHPPPTTSTPAKPFTITVTSVPSEPKKDSLTNLLAQAEQQHSKLLLKQQQALLQQQQALSRKSYEAMVADFSKIGSYSQEAKVNKWLADQTALMSPDQTVNADYLNAARRRRPRVDPTLLDWKKLTGDENVSVINRTTGKKMTGSKAPTLRRLAQWLMENPAYDVDPKWAELVKERGNLPHELLKRLPGGASGGDRKLKGPGRPQLLSSPPETPTSTAASFSALTSPSLLFDPKNNPLFDPKNPLFDPKNPLFDPKTNPFLDPKNNPLFDPKNNPLLDPKNLSLLDPKNSALFDPKNSSLFDPKSNPFFDPKNNPLLDAKNNSLFDPKNSPLFDPKNNPLFDPKNPIFDPKNNPLFDPKNSPLFDPKMLLPFGGLPNMGALGGMGHLGNPMNLFANLASLGLPSLAGLDAAGSSMQTDQASPGSSASKSKQRKSNDERHSSGKAPPVSAASQLPFYFPNPSLLYSPLGLGGLNPFSLPPSALSSAYDSIAQQCNLLNGGASTSRGSGRGSGKMSMGTSSPRHRSSSSASAAAGRDSSASSSSLQHLLLPPDTHLLDPLGRKQKPDVAARTEPKRSKPEHDRKDSLSTQSLLMSSLSEIDDRMLRRFRDTDMKEALEALSRTSAEFLAKSIGDAKPPTLAGDVTNMNMSDLLSRNIEDRPKEAAMKEALALSGTSMTEVKPDELEKRTSALFSDPPEFQTKQRETTPEPVKRKKEKAEPPRDEAKAPEPLPPAPADDGNVDVEDLLTPTTVSKLPPEQPPSESEPTSELEPNEPEKQRGPRKARGAKKSRSKSDPDEVPVVERKNLRSSAGRAARAAAERAAKEHRDSREAPRSEDEAPTDNSHDET